ncbi:DUF371 domain-containing protein [Salinigranum sp. GCM10025319]|uniref:DUF371 domain-containing protein n=1 Tax=Salinigranum sp. GCM10025319 TaxID=3252687 RepID=UPI00360AC689
MRETIRARGHDNVRAEHASTFEVTTDDWLTPAGDCILAVEADRSPSEFDPAFVDACRDRDARITARIEVGDHVQVVDGHGHPDLTFESDRSAVARTSDYVDDRTVMVDADHAAAGFDHALVESLQEGADLVLTLAVEHGGRPD